MKPEQRLGEVLKSRRLTVCTAESCTGGLIASRITDVAGSSSYMLGGVVAYANEIKQQVLRVQEETLIAHGAVSEQTAAEMAQGALALFNTDYAVSVTGIAGPGGGTALKPVGLTYIGLAGRDGTLQVEWHIWQEDREGNKRASAEAALILLLRVLDHSSPD